MQRHPKNLPWIHNTRTLYWHLCWKRNTWKNPNLFFQKIFSRSLYESNKKISFNQRDFEKKFLFTNEKRRFTLLLSAFHESIDKWIDISIWRTDRLPPNPMFVISFTCLIFSNMPSVYYLSSIYICLLFTSLIINQLILQISIPLWHARSFLSPLLIPKSVSFWMVRHILLFNWLRRGDLNWNFSLVCTHIICLHGQQHDYLRDYLYILYILTIINQTNI